MNLANFTAARVSKNSIKTNATPPIADKPKIKGLSSVSVSPNIPWILASNDGSRKAITNDVRQASASTPEVNNADRCAAFATAGLSALADRKRMPIK